jgi:hypothetical protein
MQKRPSPAELPLISRSFRILPMPLNIAREPWLRFSVLGNDWLPPPRGWDEVIKKERKAVTRRVHRPGLGWVEEISARMVDEWTLESRIEVSAGRRLVAHLLETETIGGAGYATYVDEELRGEPGSGVGRLLWGRTEARLAATIDEEWEHRRHCMLQEGVRATDPWISHVGNRRSVAPVSTRGTLEAGH